MSQSPDPAPAAPRRITVFLPQISGAGGVRTAIRMANELAVRGHTVRIATPHRPLAHRLREWVRGDFTWRASIRVPLTVFRSARQLDLRPGDVALAVGSRTIEVVSGLGTPGLVRAVWCKGFTENEPELMRPWSDPMPKIAVSPTLIGPLTRFGGGPVIGVAPNGIDLAEYFTEERAPRDGVGLIFSSNWKKDPEFTERVIASLQERRSALPLRAFGIFDGPAGLRPGGYTRGPSVAQARAIYNRSLVWLITSRSEGFCNPMLEAMACGAAVVSTAHDSAPGLIDDGHNGLLVPIGELQEFVETVERVLDDRELRGRLTAGGRETVERFTWERAAEAMETCLERAREHAGLGVEEP